MVSLSFVIAIPTMAAVTVPVSKEVPKEVRKAQIESRILEIRSLAKTNLTHAKKKALRKEVKDRRREAHSNGIYLSVGAIVIAILLLIVILK